MPKGPKITAIGDDKPINTEALGSAFSKGPSPWQPITNTKDIKHLGKLGEELNELGTVKDRISIQGLDGINPTTNEVNRVWFENELADVLCMIAHNIKHFNLDEDRIMKRMDAKIQYIKPWFDMP